MRYFNTFFWFCLVLIAIGISAAVYYGLQGFLFLPLFLIVLCISIGGMLLWRIKNGYLRTTQVIQALVQEDYAFKVPENQLPAALASPLQKLYGNLKSAKKNADAQKIVYEGIIEAMDTGILILRKGDDKLFFANRAFFQLLQMPRYNKWQNASRELKAFDAYFKEENWKNIKDVITLNINGKESDFSLRTFISYIHNQAYLVVNLDAIQSLIEKKEKEAWFNLMKVMSHEIINTMAPIQPLANNLEFLLAEHKSGLGDSYTDVKQSVETIQKRSKHLLDFIDTYRLLTELPTPKLEWVTVTNLLEGSLSLLRGLLQEKGIEVNVTIPNDKLRVYVDAKQIEQVLINLLTNCVYALDGISNPKIDFTAEQQEQKVVFTIADNGKGIAASLKRDVFVPFFTTRKNGSGIGLSLSRNIMNAHNGSIHFTSKAGTTQFYLGFKMPNH